MFQKDYTFDAFLAAEFARRAATFLKIIEHLMGLGGV